MAARELLGSLSADARGVIGAFRVRRRSGRGDEDLPIGVALRDHGCGAQPPGKAPTGGAVRPCDGAPLGEGEAVDCYLRGSVYLHACAMWLRAVARFLLWCLMTGGLAMGTAWGGRPAMLTEWLATGPPTWGAPGRRQVMISLEAARGLAAMESWMLAGCPPRADRPGRDRTGRPSTSD